MTSQADKELWDIVEQEADTRLGKAIRRLCAREMARLTSANSEDGALRHNEGRRSFAAQIRSAIDKFYEKAAPESDPRDPDLLDDTIVAPAQPVNATGGGLRRRVAAYPDAGNAA